MATHALRRAALSAPLAPGPSTAAFSLPCTKLVLQYSERAGSAKGVRQFLSSGMVVDLARRFPQVEVVVERVEGRGPVWRGVYANNRTKVIPLHSLPPSSVLSKAQLLLDSSGAKIVELRRPGVEGKAESVRGVWSAFHE
ncbi:hypothetical protein JCM10213_003482 [Rhodosporidiobolus nylandii]